MPHMSGICSEENGRVPGWAWPEEGLPVPESETYWTTAAMPTNRVVWYGAVWRGFVFQNASRGQNPENPALAFVLLSSFTDLKHINDVVRLVAQLHSNCWIQLRFAWCWRHLCSSCRSCSVSRSEKQVRADQALRVSCTSLGCCVELLALITFYNIL